MNKFIFAAASLALLGCESVPVPAPTAVAEQPTPAANIEPNSGMNRESISAIMGIENKIVVFFVAANADPAQLAAAPAKLCASRGLRLVSAEIKDLEHPASMPGIRKLVATCR